MLIIRYLSASRHPQALPISFSPPSFLFGRGLSHLHHPSPRSLRDPEDRMITCPLGSRLSTAALQRCIVPTSWPTSFSNREITFFHAFRMLHHGTIATTACGDET